MTDIFISHAEEDQDIVNLLVEGLGHSGYSTWHYERDSNLPVDFIEAVRRAIEKAHVFLLVVSSHSIKSVHVDRELFAAYDKGKHFISILRDMSYAEFQKLKPKWAFILGPMLSLPLPPGEEGVSSILPALVEGLLEKGVEPSCIPPSPQETQDFLFHLRITRGSGAGRTFPLALQDVVTVGKSKRARFSISGDDFLGRIHFLVVSTPSRCYVKDLNSTNGTSVNGRKISERTMLLPKDRIEAGENLFELI